MRPSAASPRSAPGVKIVKEGDRVGVPWLYSACGHCEHCLSAWETVCAEAEFGGYTKNGGFAEYLIADPDYVAHIPAGLDPKQAAPLICAGITTYKGIKETKAKAGRVDRHLRRRRPRTPRHSIRQGHGPSGLRRRHR
jgi:D-arabinose 1-dehydrogenase-like Zn-dependent alcohol dehydrogenase